MRAVVIGVAAACITGNAHAADLLRGSAYEGPPAKYRWSGFYFGGQAGHASIDFEFGGTTQELVANLVRALLVEQESNISTLPNLPNRDARGMSYGGFVGYNAQWGDVVLGAEVNYNRTNLYAESSDDIGRAFVTSNQFRNDVRLTSTAWARLTDYGSIRVRAGYAMGWILPYVTAGFALGQASYMRSVNVTIVETDVSPAALDPTDGIPPRPGGMLNSIASDSRNNAVTIGYALGAGVDIGLLPNVFVRGEYELMELAAVGGIGFRVNTFRAAAAVKF